jgi:HD-GYP domain-containing protein (c-di-GMP phosphodiesterase class II)
MNLSTVEQIEPAVLKIQGLLQKIDRLQLPSASRPDVQSILVRQVSKEIDRALPWQAGHGVRTAAIAAMIGQRLAMDAGELHDLKLAALLHDVGLLMLPVTLRTGRESIDPETYVSIQNHPRLGASLLEPFLFLREASIFIAHHHEWWDGSGYPYGIRGTFIPLGARILAVADAFEAVQVPGVSDPTVRDRIALRILRISSGTQFEPHLVETLSLVEESGPRLDLAEPIDGNCMDAH